MILKAETDAAVPPSWFTQALSVPVAERMTVLDGVPVAYRMWGSSQNGRGIVLVHGGGAHSRWWDHIGPLLAADRRVIAIDLSGHGDSGRREAVTYGSRRKWNSLWEEVPSHAARKTKPGSPFWQGTEKIVDGGAGGGSGGALHGGDGARSATEDRFGMYHGAGAVLRVRVSIDARPGDRQERSSTEHLSNGAREGTWAQILGGQQ